MADKDPDFERWLSFNFRAVVLPELEDELYDRFYEEWKERTKEKAESLTEPEGREFD